MMEYQKKLVCNSKTEILVRIRYGFIWLHARTEYGK